MPEIEIDPTTRIEGHHSTTLQVEDGTVTEAKSHMDMFRGAEIVTLGRRASDAPQFCQMVCGVCFTCHRMCSILALEDAAKKAGVFDGVPRDARLARDVMEGLYYLWNHAVHLFALAGPDYSDAVAGTGFERLDPMSGEGYLTALDQQRKVLQAFTEFGGRAPHPLTYAPGGVTANPDRETIGEIKSIVTEVNQWLGPTDAVPDVVEDVKNGTVDADYAQGLHDVVSILVAAKKAGADEFGVGPGRFYSNGAFHGTRDEGRVIPRGVYADGKLRRPSRQEVANAITEDTAYSWYTDDSGGSPKSAKPPEPQPDKDDAYTWGKAPRYDGQTMEVGPLARMISAELDPFDLRAALGGSPTKSSTLNRLIARAQEALVVRDKLVEWLDAIDPDGEFQAEWTDDFSGSGFGLWAPSRGALSHWVDVQDGQIERYQIITPTLWNLGPRDEAGKPSIFEGAVEGMPVEDPENPIDVMRTIRSFDPCLACSVHVQSPQGEYETVLEPASPGEMATGGADESGSHGDESECCGDDCECRDDDRGHPAPEREG
ncbi:MAG: nickel-dependent hydrogenase large subunit [Haloarculaceae archaeon]